MPFLVLDNGETLTEGVEIVQYIADQKPASGLTPAAGTLERARVTEWLYLLGDKFTVADAYLFTIINWSNFINLDLSPWPVLEEYQKRVSARPAVQAAMKKEGLLDQTSFNPNIQD